MARKWGTKLLVVAAEACGAGFGQTGTAPRRVVRLPTADSLCDRMERGEEEANTGRCSAYPIAIFEDVKARRLPTSDRRKFPSAEIFEARATLREQRESAVGRRSAEPHLSPFARRPAPPAPPPPLPDQVRPRLLGIEECPHYNRTGLPLAAE